LTNFIKCAKPFKMEKELIDLDNNKKIRVYGEHLTPVEIFKKFIFPEIKDKLYHYIWVDLFAGEGNLILPILEAIPGDERVEFFERHIFLFDVQEELIRKAVSNAMKYGIPKAIAEKNIIQRDTIKDYPTFLLNKDLPVYHITNPPYLYLGYIVKHKETQKYLEYFQAENKGLQDLYQLALINDLREGIKKMIYIIPSNFLFGLSSSNRIRDDFLKYYTISKAIIFEKKIFKHTGTNVIICYFERKGIPKDEPIEFEGIKINKSTHKRVYTLYPENHYRGGSEFDIFVKEYRAIKPVSVKYYLTADEVKEKSGDFALKVIDANAFDGNKYAELTIHVHEELYKRIKSNILFLRTVDTGSINGRAGLYLIKDVFGVDGILVTKSAYRTHPIQLFFEPQLSYEDQLLLKDYFKLVLEYFREITDSEFMTTYKYSDSKYIRKYLGLSQAKAIIETFPILYITDGEKDYLKNLLKHTNALEVIYFVKKINTWR